MPLAKPVSIYRARGFYRNGRWMDVGELTLIVHCNLDLPDESKCEFIVPAFSEENAETLAYAHLRTCHPEAIEDQLWSELIERVVDASPT